MYEKANVKNMNNNISKKEMKRLKSKIWRKNE